ncbi:MAG: chromate resistance protein ChrB domain-containing protein [Steroidobacteraceae bacterium]
MTTSSPAWLLLITNLPGRNPSLRMRIWRALKAAGTGLLRDGAYLLPRSDTARRVLEEQAVEIRAAKGTAYLLSFDAASPEQHTLLAALFDRSNEYDRVRHALAAFEREMPQLQENEARQRLAALGREAAAIIARDYFPGEPRGQIEGMLDEAEGAFNVRFSPDEPHPARHRIRRRDPRDYQGRTWATRERLWIDRVTSAWLIRRFIDPKARFLWLKRVKDCPKRAVGFDFDGAEFTHAGTKVTFEVLVASYGLERDEALCRMGAMVHHLDVGGIPTPEGAGFATIMAGARALQPDDDALLQTMTPVLDNLHAGYASARRKG